MKELKTKRLSKYFIIIQVLLSGLFSCTANSTNFLEKPSTISKPSQPILITREMKPIFIERTTPGEFESMPLSLFTADLAQEHYEETGVKLFSSLGHPDIGYRSEVCLELEPGGLAQVGDDFSEFETFVARTTLSVDNIVLTEVEGGHINLTATNVVDKKGEILIRGVGSAFICGQVVLDAGLHNVRFEFEQTSGDIQTYTWQFELTEE